MRGEEIAYIDQLEEVHYVNVGTYPSGEPMVKHERKTMPLRVLLRPRSTAGFLGGIFWVESLIQQGCKPPELITPMVFGSRQDRINPTGDTLFTAKSVARMINTLGCPTVTVLDPHSSVTPALIDRCRVITPATIMTAKWFREYCSKLVADMGPYSAVIVPDAGADARAKGVASALGIPVIHAWKVRDPATGKLSGFGYDEIDILDVEVGAKVLIVDDICDGGGTFLGLQEKLPQDLQIDLWTTHGLYTNGTRDLLAKFKNVFCTDSVVTQRPDVKIFPVCDYILRHGVLS